MTALTPRESAEILIERARSLIPALRQRSKQATAERRLPQETIDDFRRLGLTRCLQPAMFGGFGSDYRVFSKMLRTLAQGCGSSAWVAAVHGEHSWVVGNFPEPRSTTCGTTIRTRSRRRAVAPNGTAEIVAGGHRLSGRWGFASGCDHAQWILLDAMAKGGGDAENRGCFSFRSSEVEIIDDWHVHGPVRHRQQIGRRQGRRRAGAPLGQHARTQDRHRAGRGGSSRQSALPHAAQPAGAVLVELGQSSAWPSGRSPSSSPFTRERRSRGLRVADLEAVQLMVAEAAAQAEAAALVGEHTIDRNTGMVEARQEITAEQVAWSRRNASYATQLAHSAVKLIFEAAGGTALYASNPLQEIFRDIMAASAHLSLSLAPLRAAITGRSVSACRSISTRSEPNQP